MADPTTVIKIVGKFHNQTLVRGLWRQFLTQSRADCDLQYEGRSIRVHRLLLDVFLTPDADQTPTNPAPDSNSLDLLVQFMYQGNVNIRQDQLPDLLKLAREAKFQILIDAIHNSVGEEFLKIQQLFVQNEPIAQPSKKARYPPDARPKKPVQKSIIKPLKPITSIVPSTVISDPATIAAVDSLKIYARTPRAENDPIAEGSDAIFGGLAIDVESDSNLESSSTTFTSDLDYTSRLSTDHQNEPAHRPKATQPRPKATKPRPKATKPRPEVATSLLLPPGDAPSDSKRRLFDCDACDKRFTCVEMLDLHSATHTTATPFKCHVCSSRFAEGHELKTHLADHRQDGRIQCPDCPRKFTKKASFNCHREVKHLGKFYLCDQCPMRLTCKSSWINHQYTHRPMSERPFKCTYAQCRKSYPTRSSLLHHEMAHKGIKPHPCPICGRAFRIERNMKRHMLIHSDSSPFQCKSCPRAFKSMQSLKGHELVHLPQRPHSCKICGRGFLLSGNLNIHMRTHEKNDARKKRGAKDSEPASP